MILQKKARQDDGLFFAGLKKMLSDMALALSESRVTLRPQYFLKSP